MATVKLILDGEEVELRPTPHAAIAISRRADGLVPALERVAKYDEDLIAGIIALGLAADPDAIEEKVARTGVAELVEPVTEFIYLLIGGGRVPDDGETVRHWASPSEMPEIDETIQSIRKGARRSDHRFRL
jgi:hypothetical protein